jgi:tRNA threonylcarbamoyladenosine biosynthesis protein TsaE
MVAGFETLVALRSETETHALGRRIAAGLRAGEVVLLSGELGSGKTTLARAVLRALGVIDEVPSPTFTLVQSYDTPGLAVHHCDLYRIEAPAELAELGLDDALEDGALLVEWPEKGLPDRIARNAVRIALRITSELQREAYIVAPERWRTILGREAA